MINGMHALLYSTAPDETRAFFRDALRFPSVDAGRGWLIFALPPAELGIHPSESEQAPELYLMCDDLDRTLHELAAHGITVAREITEARWGRSTTIRIPGGIAVGLYEARHPTALAIAASEAAKYAAPHGGRTIIDDFAGEYRRYRTLGEKAFAQMSDDALNHVPAADANSVAMIVHHMSGNLRSRFTDFLTADGEKPWRIRDEEFKHRVSTRDEVNATWAAGWNVLEAQLDALTDVSLGQTVMIRRQPLTVNAALCRSLSHVSYHVGQIILLARITATAPWTSLSIPRGQSVAYNANPTGEKVAKS
ncbi:MAG: hypothetical protein JWM95_2547 [Gemmatimonadetes bacterium]|nr:hypothetical protein [Gemmatimonadota bacterium]